jgi:aryl sulfotransferase
MTSQYASFESSFACPGVPPKSIRTGYQDSENLRALPNTPALFVLTAPRSGTTLTSYIVKQIHDGDLSDSGYDGTGYFQSHNERVPWVDGLFFPREELERLIEVAQDAELRLLYKTHLEPFAIPAIEGARMIVVGRPPADVAVSLWDYFTGIKPFGFAVHDEAAKRRGWNNGTFPRPADYPSTGEFFRQWVNRRGFPFVDLVEIYRQAWGLRGHENVLLLHYNEIIGDMPAAVRRIAAFERVDLPEARVQEIVALCRFDEMRRQSRAIAPSHKRFDTEHHLNKGIAGRGAELFPRQDFPEEYRVLENALGSDCFAWLNQTP